MRCTPMQKQSIARAVKWYFTYSKYRLERHFHKSTVNMEVSAATEVKEDFDTLEEGKAKIIVDKKNIFYNPVQEFNRDISIAVLTQYSDERSQNNVEKPDTGQNSEKGLRVLEALSATGLRSIRYAKEVPGIREIIANDLSAKAVNAMKKNIIYNNVEKVVTPNLGDAIMVMHENSILKFDVVDLDPYGCPSIFLDGAIRCIKDNGLLLVTATDMAILAGNVPEVCYVKYGAISLKTKSCHEMALRILLQHIISHAGRYGKVVTPILSISADFYIRVFVKIHTSQQACKHNTRNLGYIYQCTGCESITIQPLGTVINNVNKLPHTPAVEKLCSYCKHKHHMGGPVWIGPLHDKNFIHQILNRIESEGDNNIKSLKTLNRIKGILHLAWEELDNPLYYQLDRLMSIIKCVVPPMAQFRSALLNAGYKVSYSHANKQSVKTDAPNHVIWDVVRAWEKENPVKREKFDKNSAALTILNTESTTEISFKIHPDAVPFSRQKRLTRFQLNPETCWGPGRRATIMTSDERISTKKERNQNKKRKKKQSDNEQPVEEKKINITEENV